MLDPKLLDDLAGRLASALPSGVRELREDAERNMRAALQAALGRMELVTREEFDVQSEVLVRTRARLKDLEARISRLEQEVLDTNPPRD